MQRIRIHKFMKTEDDWCPNYDDDQVCVNLTYFFDDIIRNKYVVGITVAGKDDTVMEIRHCYTSKEKADKCYEQFLDLYNTLPEPLNKDWLLDHDFNYS